MKKPNDAVIQKQLKDIQANSKELIDAVIWYDQHEMNDWMYDIIGHFENLDPHVELKILLDDFPHRTIDDLNNYGYQRLFIALINSDRQLWKEVPDKTKNALIKAWSFLV